MSTLLEADEPPPFVLHQPPTPTPYVLCCDHAGRYIPRKLGNLGLSEAELSMHIASDIGASGMARELQERLGAYLIEQPYSRLVIDCNRPPGVPSSIVEKSEYVEIARNRGLSDAERQARVDEIFHPYQREIEREIERRVTNAEPTLFISVHSFTPRYMGDARRWHAGVLYNRDPRLARFVIDMLSADPELCIGDNEPYFLSDETDFTVVQHAERRGLPHIELEIRQDLITHRAGQIEWAERMSAILIAARAHFC